MKIKKNNLLLYYLYYLYFSKVEIINISLSQMSYTLELNFPNI